MKTYLKITAYIGLALTIVPAVLTFGDVLSLDQTKILMLIGTIIWFLAIVLADRLNPSTNG